MKLGHITSGEHRIPVLIEGESVIELDGDIFGEIKPSDRRRELSDVKFAVPVLPRQMFGAGINFREHVLQHNTIWNRPKDELPTEPTVSLKPISAVVGPDMPILVPRERISHVHHEAECIAVIGTYCRSASPDLAGSCILGYTCGNDLHDLGWLRTDLSVWRAKGRVGYSPIGPWIDTAFDPSGSEAVAQLFIDGHFVHDLELSSMIFDFPTVISYISQHVPLWPGDLVWSGAASSVPAHGDEAATVTIPAIGSLSNRVVLEA